MNLLKILFVAAEVAPFASVGGLSQVMYFLPRALKTIGHDVRVFMPKYGTIDEKKYGIRMCLPNLKVPTGEVKGVTELVCNVKMRSGTKTDPTVYFLENMEYYEQRANVYGYNDDPVRFGLLSRGALEFLKKNDWQSDIIHTNDWHTGYLVNYLRTVYRDDPKLEKIATLFTIHNLALQGVVDFRYVPPSDLDDGNGPLASLLSDRLSKQNALKRGVMYADIVNTVSERYSREILKPEYGQGLDGFLKEVRVKLYGVLNGIDYEDFNPAKDKLIKKNYTAEDLENRVENKIDLQKEFDLPVDPKIPLLAMSCRLSEQKGWDLVMKVLPYLLKEFEIQFIIVGEGETRYREYFTQLEKDFPDQVGTHLMLNWQLPRKIFSGADMLLLPSKFEPGGIVVIEGMRYGAVPVVRATGGLADIVEDFNIGKNSGNGFTFREYSELSFFGALTRALEIYRYDTMWAKLVKRTMQADYSWNSSALKYIDLYQRAIEYHKEMLSDNPPEAFRK